MVRDGRLPNHAPVRPKGIIIAIQQRTGVGADFLKIASRVMDANTRASRISRGIPTGKEWIPRGGNFILHLEKQVIASINETIGGNVVAVSQPNDTCSLRCKASGGGVAILGLIIEPHLQI